MPVLTMCDVQVIGGQVTPLLVGPIAIKTALADGHRPARHGIGGGDRMLAGVHHAYRPSVNILMMGPGGYKFSDFPRVGIGMTLVTLLTMLLGLALLWGV